MLPVNSNLAELDFAKIKENLILSYKSNPKFVDYDFSGSTLSTILDILAYTTHYQGVYANMAFSERFLDSAQLRDSVISIVKELGYLPRQAQASKATVNLTIQNTNVPSAPQNIIAKKGDSFTGKTTDGTTFNFVVGVDTNIPRGDASYSGNVQILQGNPAVKRFAFNTNTSSFVLPQENVDTSSIIVKIKTTTDVPDSQAVLWTLSDNILVNTPTSLVYHLEETTSNKISVFFGDGILGQSPIDGNEIIVYYMTTDGIKSNGAGGFELISSIETISPALFSVVVVDKAQGGGEAETIDSIKHNAPNSFQAQGRAVTTEDYRTLMISKYSWIESINVWGGEDNIPAQYGRVFISIKPNFGNYVPSAFKDDIMVFLNTKKMVGIQVVVLDPSIIYLNTKTIARYISANTTDSRIVVAQNINDAITNHIRTSSSAFNKKIKYSNILTEIDAAHPAITSNETTITISGKFSPSTTAPRNETVNLSNSILPNTVKSKQWKSVDGLYIYYLADDGNGLVFLYVADSTTLNFLQVAVKPEDQSVVNYSAGTIDILAFHPDIDVNNIIEIEAEPASYDIISASNLIVESGEHTTEVRDDS